jgi:hypothetical protein
MQQADRLAASGNMGQICGRCSDLHFRRPFSELLQVVARFRPFGHTMHPD